MPAAASIRAAREGRRNARQSLAARLSAGAAVGALALAPGALASPVPVNFSSDPNTIVTVNVSTVIAPTPNTYQQTGCFVSYGGTTLVPQTCQYLTQFGDLAPVLAPAVTPSSVAWAAGTATFTMPTAMAFQPGDTPVVTISGYVPAAYNSSKATVTIVDAHTFTLTNSALTTNPGPVTTAGTVQLHEAVQLSQMAATFFGQGNRVGVYVLELGWSAVGMTQRATNLQTWLTNNPRSFYGYFLPRESGGTIGSIINYETVFKRYCSPTSMTYFWLTVGAGLNTTLDATYKCVVEFTDAPGVGADPNIGASGGEFSAAAMFYNALAYTPSPSNPVAPMAFKEVYGVTPYPTQNNGPTLTGFKASNTNYIATGAEGGISDAIIYEGVTKDGQDYFNWWWIIDYCQITVALDIANAIINGSNNPLAPLYYDQTGIDVLLGVLYRTMKAMQTMGMVLGKLVMTELNGPDLGLAINGGAFAGECDCNAVPFIDYSLAKPGDYKIGEYDGLSTLFIPRRGFIHVLVTIVASNLITV